MKVYKCFTSDFQDLEKKIKRITKKLNKNSLKWSFEVLGESVEEVRVIDYVNRDNIPSWQFSPKDCGTVVVDVTSYTFEMESLKLGEFEVLAVIEHNAVEDTNENIIHVIKEGENVSIPVEYRTIKSHCQHCNSDRKRNKTVLLINAENQIIQVGSTCIKEYTGIDGLSIIGNYQDIHDICIEEPKMDYDNLGKQSKYLKTLDYLTNCLSLINSEGYKKEETKNGAWELTKKCGKNEKYKVMANEVINYFKNKEFKEYETFQNNIKVYLSNEYTKINGIVAYAYVSYQKEIEKDEKKAREQEGKKNSNHVGNTGDKLEVNLTLKKRVSYGTSYNGYTETTQYIYLFEDTEGNIYKWNTAKFLELDNGDSVKVKGTIKDHTEYAGAKQTVLTRCKIA